MAGKTKLELTWIGKDERPRLEPRILIEEPEFSHHAETRREGDHFDNMLIHGDNLLALKALETDPNVRGKVKCIYIDPPYNTGSAFEHYDDGMEHSLWLSLMRDRIIILRNLLREDGLMFVQIDDNEFAYLTVMMDEIFGRSNRMNVVAIKMSEATGVKMAHASKRMPKQKEYILVYKKSGTPVVNPIKIPLEKWNYEYKEILLGISEADLEEVKEYIDADTATNDDVRRVNDILKDAYIISANKYFKENRIPEAEQEQWLWDNAHRVVQAVGAGSLRERALQARINKSVSAVLSARKKLSVFKTNFDQDSKDPRIRLLFADKYLTYNPGDFWADIKTAGGVAEEGGVQFPNGKKPEALLHRIISYSTNPGDLVLDSFAGSGTTGAVAHKMGRRWIMVELRDQSKTHIAPRLKSVINGADKSGATSVTGWKGGGGFRFLKIAPSLLNSDKWGRLVINDVYQPEMLAEAMCKHFNYTYAPSADHYWMHGHASEAAYIYVTTNSLTFEQLKAISDEVGETRSLLVCCMAYEPAGDDLPNLTIKKIPRVVLDRCEWGKDDYSLKIAALPLREEDPEEDLPEAKPKKTKTPKAQASLFDQAED